MAITAQDHVRQPGTPLKPVAVRANLERTLAVDDIDDVQCDEGDDFVSRSETQQPPIVIEVAPESASGCETSTHVCPSSALTLDVAHDHSGSPSDYSSQVHYGRSSLGNFPSTSRRSKDDDLPPLPTLASQIRPTSGLFQRITSKLRSPTTSQFPASTLNINTTSALSPSGKTQRDRSRSPSRSPSRDHTRASTPFDADAPQPPSPLPPPTKRKPALYLALPRAPIPGPLPGSFTSAEQRQAALRARGLLPPSPYTPRYRDAQGYMLSLSEQEAELDRHFAIVLGEPRGSRDGEGEDGDSAAQRIKEAWLAKNREGNVPVDRVYEGPITKGVEAPNATEMRIVQSGDDHLACPEEKSERATTMDASSLVVNTTAQDYNRLVGATQMSPSTEQLARSSMDAFVTEHAPSSPPQRRLPAKPRRSSDVSERVSRWLHSALPRSASSPTQTSFKAEGESTGFFSRKSSDRARPSVTVVTRPGERNENVARRRSEASVDGVPADPSASTTSPDEPAPPPVPAKTRRPPPQRKLPPPPSAYTPPPIDGKERQTSPVASPRASSSSSSSAPAVAIAVSLPTDSITSRMSPDLTDSEHAHGAKAPPVGRGRSTSVAQSQASSTSPPRSHLFTQSPAPPQAPSQSPAPPSPWHQFTYPWHPQNALGLTAAPARPPAPESRRSTDARGRSSKLPALSPTRTASSSAPSEGVPPTPTTPYDAKNNARARSRTRRPMGHAAHHTGGVKVAGGEETRGRGGSMGDGEEDDAGCKVIVESPIADDSSSDWETPVSADPARMHDEAQKMRELMAAAEGDVHPRGRRKSRDTNRRRSMTLGVFSRKSVVSEDTPAPPPFKNPRPMSSMQNLRRSITSTLTTLRVTRPNPSVNPSAVPPLPISPTSPSYAASPTSPYPTSVPPTSFPPALRVRVSQEAISPVDSIAPRKSTVGQGLRPRQALSPTMHNRGSILVEATRIEDAESRRLSEMAFLDY
ncbi:uncharacterized protein FIBRA_01336 [Fibroporia radiculosa]|uniref:Uncharacterized protein n=1 Tax=Fibroporia radiculosa TaxID=599839 RepID=J4GJW5_9APHY|nr:uncharacterized protein FIBRA_01336 [Fibroporia radiculosa]CCL99320.1 predicted protein [Fibroporia radiculosa]